MGLDINFYKRKITDVGYFRKVNFLVSFFKSRDYDVKNCAPLEINKTDIETLIDYCERVLENHALGDILLPTTEGFFFGSTTYDEHYYNDVKEVLDFCKNTLLNEFNTLKDDESIIFEIWY